MSGAKAAKKKQSFWETLHAASGTYRRLYGYVKPYKVRFILGLALGLAYGGVNSLLPWATAGVASTHVTPSASRSAVRNRGEDPCRRRGRDGTWAGFAIGRVILKRPSYKGTADRKSAT